MKLDPVVRKAVGPAHHAASGLDRDGKVLLATAVAAYYQAGSDPHTKLMRNQIVEDALEGHTLDPDPANPNAPTDVPGLFSVFPDYSPDHKNRQLDEKQKAVYKAVWILRL